VTYGMQ